MNKTRVIPVLLLRGKGLVKTVKFKDAKYIGDPRDAGGLWLGNVAGHHDCLADR
jgi:imidazole glycerol phosphate synthase subunit HisF